MGHKTWGRYQANRSYRDALNGRRTSSETVGNCPSCGRSKSEHYCGNELCGRSPLHPSNRKLQY